jgi:hypothetical protein
MQILGKIKDIQKGYNSKTMEVFIIDQLGNTYKNIVPKIKVNYNDVVICDLYRNLYSVQVEKITKKL